MHPEETARAAGDAGRSPGARRRHLRRVLVRRLARNAAIVYALSGVFFLTMVAVLLAPALQHVMHRLHLELDESKGHRP